nr:uncharacterized protein LOC101421659 [Dasypus novemcinctus]
MAQGYLTEINLYPSWFEPQDGDWPAPPAGSSAQGVPKRVLAPPQPPRHSRAGPPGRSCACALSATPPGAPGRLAASPVAVTRRAARFLLPAPHAGAPRRRVLSSPTAPLPAVSSHSRVALVTGANKGIGFAITRELCRRFSGDVVLTARDAARGRAAVQQLQAEGLSPRFHQLDIDDPQSIRVLRDFLRREYGGLDVLVNNAGIAFKAVDPTPFHIQAEVTMKTNFFGTQAVCTELSLGPHWSVFPAGCGPCLHLTPPAPLPLSLRAWLGEAGLSLCLHPVPQDFVTFFSRALGTYWSSHPPTFLSFRSWLGCLSGLLFPPRPLDSHPCHLPSCSVLLGWWGCTASSSLGPAGSLFLARSNFLSLRPTDSSSCFSVASCLPSFISISKNKHFQGAFILCPQPSWPMIVPFTQPGSWMSPCPVPLKSFTRS